MNLGWRKVAAFPVSNRAANDYYQEQLRRHRIRWQVVRHPLRSEACYYFVHERNACCARTIALAIAQVVEGWKEEGCAEEHGAA